MKRLLLRRITESLLDEGLLQYFQSIAATTGFLDVVSNLITELKREEVWPVKFIDVCRARNSASWQRDQELGLIYDRYQKHLEQQNWYDNEGRFWLARTYLSEGIRGPFANVRFLAVDGFADFTQTQYEILGYFARWMNQIVIALPVEHPSHRPELFSKPQASISRIREQLPAETKFRIVPMSAGVSVTSRAKQGWSRSIGVIADQLFTNPRFCPLSNQTDGLEIIQATGQFGEWEAVAARIKTLLSGHSDNPSSASPAPSASVPARPQQIVIGMRSLSEDGPRLRRYLESAGLPAWCEAGSPLNSSPIVKALIQLLQLELDDWPFDRILAVLDSSYFRPDWPEWKSGDASRVVAACLRRLRLGSGRETMIKSLTRFSSDSTSSSSVEESLAASIRVALPLLNRLSRCLEKLRRSHTLEDWADVLATIVDDLGWRVSETQADVQSVLLQENERLELDLFQRILRTAAEADQKLSGRERPRTMTLQAFTAELRDLLSHETLKPPPEPAGCLRILDVEQIRNLDIPHLFLIGLTEDCFPRNRADDCLFSELERQEFISRGVALNHRSRRNADEMFLFYSIVTRARCSLTISYAVVNTKGQPVYASPYVTALTSIFARSSLTVSSEGKLDPVPSVDRTLTRTDLRLTAMVEARHGRPGLFHRLLEDDSVRVPCLNTLAACDVADHRFHLPGFTAYEGQLELASNLDWLGRRFGAQHQFSATELEAYARCPFQFWLSTVLDIDSVESPEEGTDFALRGTLLHEVLAQLLVEGLLDDPDALQDRFRQLVDEKLGRQFPQTELQRALVQIERSILSSWADAFADQQNDYRAKIEDFLKRTHSLPPEIPFGSLPGMTSTQPTHPPIQFGHGEESVNIRGRIDRVDVGTHDGHPAYVVVDYKTGQRPTSRPEDLVSGRSIQLALYLIAVKRLGLTGPDSIPLQMGYWALRETGFKHGLGKSKFQPANPGEVQWLESVLDKLLPELAAEIRTGRFVVENSDKNCAGRCRFRTVCRVNQLRPLAESLKKQSPERTADPTQ